MTNPQKLGTQRMWSAAHRRQRSRSYRLMRRDSHSLEERWTQLSAFVDASKAAEALDEAVASGEGELDDYRIDEQKLSSRQWLQPSTWLSPNRT